MAVLVELKARFGRGNNVELHPSWRRPASTWSTACRPQDPHQDQLVVREEAGGLRTYCHVGTGNFNPKTARLRKGIPDWAEHYAPVRFSSPGYARDVNYKKLLIAPNDLRPRLKERLAERQMQAEGDRRLTFKMNSLGHLQSARRGVAVRRADPSSSGRSAARGRGARPLRQHPACARSSAATSSTPAFTGSPTAVPMAGTCTTSGRPTSCLQPRPQGRGPGPGRRPRPARTSSTRSSSTSSWPTTSRPGAGRGRHLAQGRIEAAGSTATAGCRSWPWPGGCRRGADLDVMDIAAGDQARGGRRLRGPFARRGVAPLEPAASMRCTTTRSISGCSTRASPCVGAAARHLGGRSSSPRPRWRRPAVAGPAARLDIDSDAVEPPSTWSELVSWPGRRWRRWPGWCRSASGGARRRRRLDPAEVVPTTRVSAAGDGGARRTVALGAPKVSFREIEVEFDADAPAELIEVVVERFRAAGCPRLRRHAEGRAGAGPAGAPLT